MSDTSTQTGTRTTNITEAATGLGFQTNWLFIFIVGVMLAILTSFIGVLTTTGMMAANANAVTWLNFLGVTGISIGLVGAGLTGTNAGNGTRVAFVVAGLVIMLGGAGVF